MYFLKIEASQPDKMVIEEQVPKNTHKSDNQLFIIKIEITVRKSKEPK